MGDSPAGEHNVFSCDVMLNSQHIWTDGVHLKDKFGILQLKPCKIVSDEIEMVKIVF